MSTAESVRSGWGSWAGDGRERPWADRLAALFPPAQRRIGRRQGVLVGAAVILAGAVVSLLRQPGAGAWDTIWAEDGEIFLADAVNSSLPGALTGSYAGYFHIGPRLLAELAALTPAGWDAAVLASSAAVVTAVLAVLVYAASAAHLRSQVARVAAAAVVVVPPLAQQDVPNSIANLHWPALYALFWTLLWTPARWSGRAVAVTTVALVVTSDILVVALLPLAVVRLVARRDRYSALLAAVFSAGVALQLLGLVSGSSSRDTDLNPVRAAVGYLLRAVPAGLLGSRWLGEDHTSVRWLALAGVAWLLVLAAVAAALWHATRRPSQPQHPPFGSQASPQHPPFGSQASPQHPPFGSQASPQHPPFGSQASPNWILATVAAVHSVALYVLPVFLSGTATERYAVAPTMLLVVALLALLLPEPGRIRRAGVVLLVLLAVVWAVNLRVPNLRAEGPSWSDELDRAKVTCTEQTVEEASVRIPPRDASWHAELPCTYITR